MIALGKFSELEVLRQVEQGMYLDAGPLGDILLPNRYIPEGLEVGEDVRVFLYCDSMDRPIATTETPLAQADEFAFLQVKEVNDFGAFLDWGLTKDLIVPFREQNSPMEAGEFYVVRVYVDSTTDRMVATSRLGRYLKKENEMLKEGEEVSVMVVSEAENGYRVIVEEEYWGRIYANEIFQPIKSGDRLTAYVKKIREDKLLDISLQRNNHEEVSTAAQTILDKVKEAGGLLALTDKSSPELIYEELKMSKKAFKRTIGMLYKQRLVALEKEGIRLIPKESRIVKKK